MSADHDARLAKFLAGNPVPIDHLLRTLPATANLALAVEAVLRMVDHPHWLAGCGELPVRLVRGVLAAPPCTDSPGHVFLQLAVRADAKATVLRTAWQQAVEALRQLADTKHPLDTDTRRSQLAAIAKTPPLLQAIQGVTANTTEVPVEMLVVLAIDGTDASVDALIPHLDLALGSRDVRLERLATVRPFVCATPALDALFAELDGALQARRSTSPALAFGTTLIAGELPQFWFWFLLMSSNRNETGLPAIQGSVRVDSREEPWFRVEVSRVHGSPDRTKDQTTRFDVAQLSDELGLYD